MPAPGCFRVSLSIEVLFDRPVGRDEFGSVSDPGVFGEDVQSHPEVGGQLEHIMGPASIAGLFLDRIDDTHQIQFEQVVTQAALGTNVGVDRSGDVLVPGVQFGRFRGC